MKLQQCQHSHSLLQFLKYRIGIYNQNCMLCRCFFFFFFTLCCQITSHFITKQIIFLQFSVMAKYGMHIFLYLEHYFDYLSIDVKKLKCVLYHIFFINFLNFAFEKKLNIAKFLNQIYIDVIHLQLCLDFDYMEASEPK